MLDSTFSGGGPYHLFGQTEVFTIYQLEDMRVTFIANNQSLQHGSFNWIISTGQSLLTTAELTEYVKSRNRSLFETERHGEERHLVVTQATIELNGTEYGFDTTAGIKSPKIPLVIGSKMMPLCIWS